MEDLFRSYGWLIFPLGWFVASGFTTLLNYRRQKDTLKLIQAYADKGQEPPAALLKVLERPIDADDDSWRTRRDGLFDDRNALPLGQSLDHVAGFGPGAVGNRLVILDAQIGIVALQCIKRVGIARRGLD